MSLQLWYTQTLTLTKEHEWYETEAVKNGCVGSVYVCVCERERERERENVRLELIH